MDLTHDQVEELRSFCDGVARAAEGGYTYLLLSGLRLPPGAAPALIDALLCPMPRDGYTSRLFFAARVTARQALNWNGSIRILERNWEAFSWCISQTNLRPAQMLATHLTALR